MERKKITFDSFIRGAIICGVVIAILMLLKRLSSVLLPFFIAWLAAYLIYPLVTFFQHRLKLRNRALSIFCALLLLAAIGTAAFYLLVPPMVQEFSRVKDLLMAYFTDSSYGSNVPRSLSDFLRENIDPALLKQLFKKKPTEYVERSCTSFMVIGHRIHQPYIWSIHDIHYLTLHRIHIVRL